MKTYLAILISFISITQLQAQSRPLKGSGKVTSITSDIKNFDKIDFIGLDGKINVSIGKTWSIQVTIDDNLAPLLVFKKDEKEYRLTVMIDKNKNNIRYLEDTKIVVSITMPEASVITNESNASLSVENLIGRYFRLENTGNGSAELTGKIDKLDIKKTGNGRVDASKLFAKNVEVKCQGNGAVTVNASQEFEVKGTGNGYIKNIGLAKATSDSRLNGNGKIVYQ